MKRFKHTLLVLCLLLMAGLNALAQGLPVVGGKEIYIPRDLRNNDFNNPESKWSYTRMATTENFVVFWEKGFGNDLSKAPQLEGQNMNVDLSNLLEKLEEFYRFYRDELKFVLPGSKSERYRMMVMLNYSLEGTAYGGDYDGEIGALWIAPNRVQDKKLNCIAHELGHSFQSQVMCDGAGEAWGGGGIFEMTSQWMLWNVNSEWTTDENYHWQDFKKKIHYPFLHGTNIYHSPYVLEYWSMKHGKTIIADLFRQGKRGEDPAMTYMRMNNLTLDQMADEMYDCYARLQTFDFPRVKESHRKFAGEMVTPGIDFEYFVPSAESLPGAFGFNVRDVEIPQNGTSARICFEGLGDPKKDGFRYGLVAIDQQGNATYGKMQTAFKGEASVKVNERTKQVKLVVMGYPKDEYTPMKWGDTEYRTFSYRVSSDKKNKLYTVASPNGKIRAEINADNLGYSLFDNGKLLMTDNGIALKIEGFGYTSKVLSAKRTSVNEEIEAPFYRQAKFPTSYNALTLTLKGDVNLEMRAYDSGIAYRFITTDKKKEYVITDETAEFNFTGRNYMAYIPYSTNKEKPEAMAFQATYEVTPLEYATAQLAFTPLTVDCHMAKVTIMESDLEAYPGLFIRPSYGLLEGHFSRYPKTTDFYPWRMQEYVTSTENYIARINGARTLPWRIVAVAHDDAEMPVNNLVYALASPNRIGDTSWIKPGKVAWDWWNDWGVSGVDFKAGINMATYKHYIDFAARYGLEYIILDEGWYDPKSGNMMETISDIDLPTLVEYGKSKGVGIFLWTVFNVLDKDLEAACKKYADMGIRGFKVDFLDRNDQTGVEMVYRICQACADHKLMLDLHGIYAPTGINRTFPNVINFEGVFGMEEAKWSKADEKDMPLYDVTFPYIRMQAGFVDFTPGGFRNATRKDFQPVYYNPMTMGTRCHQMAMYVLHDSPFTMLADNPTIYEREEECTRFIATIPTVYDEMKVVAGKMGEYIVIARRKGNDWYVAGQTNWEAREIELSLDFVGNLAEYAIESATDGINADKVATDYVMTKMDVVPEKQSIRMASGGGFVMKLKKK